MPRASSFPPYPRKAHSSGQARITVARQAHYLGLHGSPESWAEYHRLLAEWRQGRLAPTATDSLVRLTVADLIARFMKHGRERRFRDREGRLKDEYHNYRFSLEPVLELYGRLPAGDFLARQLGAARDAMADGSWMSPERRQQASRRRNGRGWARSVCNRSLSRVKLVWRWAEREGLVPEGRSAHLDTVPGFELDECGVRETDDVAPVAEEDLAATLPHLNHVVRAIVELLLLTGARPKELRLLRPRDINRQGRVEAAKGYWIDLGDVWAVRLARHKTAHKKVRRVILFGPRARQILEPFLDGRDPDAYLFSPAEAMARRDQERRAARRSKVPPSQVCRKKPDPQRKPADHYSRRALEKSIDYASRKAGMDVRPWAPYQLRHLAATRMVAELGWETTRILLGHTREEMTRRYGLEDLRKAADAARQTG